MPNWMTNSLTNVQKSFADGTSIRCRSSTNNEYLPGFSGGELYDSYTRHEDEGHLAKSIKQVYARNGTVVILRARSFSIDRRVEI